MPSNDQLSDLEKSLPRVSIFFTGICQLSGRELPAYRIPLVFAHKFQILILPWVPCTEVYTSSPHQPHPKWFFILGNYDYMNVMSVVSVLWPICKSEGASKIFHSMNYIFLCCLLVSSANATNPQRLTGLCGACQINRSLSKIPSTAVTTTRWQPQVQRLLSHLKGVGEKDFPGKKQIWSPSRLSWSMITGLLQGLLWLE